ncbi:DUF305 domain-containing protein [Streptomyces sp. NPDC087263]|uniref:DUF305 domain-containing protein n=1 Tax=Streptomyces sp. NPDC087263 TaxID=3365773 RepID=UPI0037FBDB1C
MTAHRTIICRTALAATTAVAALVLTACSDGAGGGHDMGSMESNSSPTATSTSTASAKAGDHNDADVSFSTEMIQHHRQAIDMAELADSRASSQEVKDLATKIKGAQDPEIRTMSGWLTSWGEAVPDDMSGMEHDTSSTMPGMMSSDDMAKLDKASGAEFDTMFLTMMVQHHEGAIEMAKTEQANGTYGPATKLADAVVTAQTAEIEQMKQMLEKS